jgi:hypothetical protein
MLTITFSTTVDTSSSPLLREALQAYERRFGSPPVWLDELSSGRILSLVQQALKRGVPLIAAEVLH